jgi:hypothetical protein
MFYERAADGKQYPQKTEQPAATTNIFKNRQRQDFLKDLWSKGLENMMNWKGLAGNGKVWTAAW